MGTIAATGATTFRDFETDGVPSSGLHDPIKGDVRTLMAIIDAAIQALQVSQTGAALAFDTRANLFADLAYDANTQAFVYEDLTSSYNGIYSKSGASGSGSWVKVSNLIYGLTPSFTLGSVTTVNAMSAAVSLTGGPTAPVLNFQIPRGTIIWSTTGAPSNSLGVDGDYAIDPSNYTLYGPKAGGVWPAPSATAQSAAATAGAAATSAAASATSAAASATSAAASATAAAGSAGALNPISANTTLTVGPGQTYATVALALAYLQSYRILPTATVTISCVGSSSLGAGLTWLHPDSDRILIRGAAPVALTWGGVVSVTGSKGAWSVTYTFTGSSGLGANAPAIGQVVKITGFPQSMPLQGLGSGPVLGQCSYGISHSNGNLSASCTAGTNTAVFSGTFNGAVGDIIILQGQIRAVTGGVGTTNVTVNVNFNQTCAGLNYWLWMKGEAGTIAATAGVVTGSGTTFTSRLSAAGGDILIPADGSETPLIIQSRTSSTGAVLERSVTIASGTPFAIINPIWQHVGAWKITGVSGDNVTVANTSWSDYQPPITGLSTPTINLLTTILTSTNAGFTAASRVLDIDQLAMIGPYSSSMQGNGVTTEDQPPSLVRLGSSTAILNFNSGVKLYGPSYLYALGASLCSNVFAGIYGEGGEAYLKNANLCANGLTSGYGAVWDGAHYYLTGVHACCNYEDALRTDDGGWMWADYLIGNGNGGRACQFIGISGGHTVGCQFIFDGWNAGGAGLNYQNGASGRSSGDVILCCQSGGVIAANARGEWTWVWAGGCIGDGFDLSGASTPSMEICAATGNVGVGVSVNVSFADVIKLYAYNNYYNGLAANVQSIINAQYSAFGSNGGGSDVSAAGGAKIDITGHVGSLTTNITLNKIMQAGAYVTDGGYMTLGP